MFILNHLVSNLHTISRQWLSFSEVSSNFKEYIPVLNCKANNHCIVATSAISDEIHCTDINLHRPLQIVRLLIFCPLTLFKSK